MLASIPQAEAEIQIALHTLMSFGKCRLPYKIYSVKELFTKKGVAAMSQEQSEQVVNNIYANIASMLIGQLIPQFKTQKEHDDFNAQKEKCTQIRMLEWAVDTYSDSVTYTVGAKQSDEPSPFNVIRFVIIRSYEEQIANKVNAKIRKGA